MNVDISFDQQNSSAILKFKTQDFTSELQTKETLAIIAIISGDFYLDPEIDPEHLSEYIGIAKENNKDYLLFEISEEGVELELK